MVTMTFQSSNLLQLLLPSDGLEFPLYLLHLLRAQLTLITKLIEESYLRTYGSSRWVGKENA